MNGKKDLRQVIAEMEKVIEKESLDALCEGIEAAEELMRQMIAGQAPLDSKVVRRIPDPEEKNRKSSVGFAVTSYSSASSPSKFVLTLYT